MGRIKKQVKKFRQKLELPFVRFGLTLIPRLPRWAVLGTARALGNLGYGCSARTRRLGLTNLDLAFGDSKTRMEKKRILRESLRNFALVMLDLLWFSRNSVARMDRWFEATPRLQEALAVRKARVGVTGHFGNWELTGRYWALRAGSLMSVAMPVKNLSVDALLQDAREKNGQQIIAREGALKKLVRCLREGGTVGLLLDQNTAPDQGGVFADFFGKPVAVSPAAGLLASMTGAEIFVAFTLPCPDGRYSGDLPYVISPAEIAAIDRARVAEEITRRITTFYEELIRARPDCWLWTYKRWRYIPKELRKPDSNDGFPYYADRPPLEPITP